MRNPRTGWLLLSPTLIILLIFGFVPFLYVLFVGFNQWNIFSAEDGLVFNGLDNFRRLVFDQDFLNSVGLTAEVRSLRDFHPGHPRLLAGAVVDA